MKNVETKLEGTTLVRRIPDLYRGFESHLLRQDALSGHSFSAPDPRSESRRMRPFLANCPNHEDGLRAHFGPFFVSLGPLSPKQPNHGHFGTDVESSIIQRVEWRLKVCGFERRPLRRGRPGSNDPVRTHLVGAGLSEADLEVVEPSDAPQ
jgi:hypothetical protein